MSFIPKSTKFQKFQRNKLNHSPSRTTNLGFGVHGLKVRYNCFITSNQLDMLRMELGKSTKKIGRYWIRVFARTPVTSKPLEVRMGKGKGYIDHWVCKLRAGSVLCELSGLAAKQAFSVLRKIAFKLPVKVLYISKELC